MIPASGLAFHQPDQRGQALPAHDAVGVEDDHVAVVAAPAPAEVGDVAALALDAVLAPAVENAAEAVHFLAQALPGVELGDARVGIIAVAQHEEVEPVELARTHQRLVSGLQPGEHPRHLLVADRHHDGSARQGIDRLAALEIA